MSANYVYIYPEPDYTGINPKYLVTNEERDLVDEGGYYLTLPNSGPFYADTMEIYDATTDARLVEDDDFTFDVFESDATRKSNKDVFAAIRFNKEKYPTLSDIPKIRLKYQFVGGPYHANIAGLIQAVSDLENVAGIVYWDNIEGKPTTYPPSFHLHKASDITHLDSTNDILREINTSIQDLADRLVNAKEPKFNVTYEGRIKYGLDAGRELNSGMGDSIWLQFPRSETENAQFGLIVEVMTDARSYYWRFLGKEHPETGFVPESLSLLTDMADDHPFESVEVSTLLGQSYLQIKPQGNIPGGYYVVKQATVNHHAPEEWITPLIWHPAPPDSNDPEFKKHTVPVVGSATISSLENNRDTKRNLLTKYSGEVLEDATLALRFPKGQTKDHLQTVHLSVLSDDVYQEFIVSCFVGNDGSLSNVTARAVSEVNDQLLHVVGHTTDSAYGYLLLSHLKEGTIGYAEVNIISVCLSANGEELNEHWTFLPDFDTTNHTVTPIAIEDIVNMQSRHTHEIEAVNGLQAALDGINSSLSSLGTQISTLSDSVTQQGEAISNIDTTLQNHAQALTELSEKFLYQHTLDMTALDPTLYYLVELVPVVGSYTPEKLTMLVAPVKDTATADHYGLVQGEFMVADEYTRPDYYNYLALAAGDGSKLSMDSMWYNVPTHADHDTRLFVYVKGGEMLQLETTCKTAVLHDVDDVVIDNDGTDNIVVSTGVGTIPVETTEWFQLTAFVGNTRSSSI